MREDAPTPAQDAPITRKQLFAGLAGAGGFFGYLAIATIFNDNPTVRLLMIGPYGISAGIWLGSAFATLWFFAQREKRRLGH